MRKNILALLILLFVVTGCQSDDESEDQATQTDQTEQKTEKSNDSADTKEKTDQELEDQWQANKDKRQKEKEKQEKIEEEQERRRNKEQEDIDALIAYTEQKFSGDIIIDYNRDYNAITILSRANETSNMIIDTLSGEIDKSVWNPLFGSLNDVSIELSEQINDPKLTVAYLNPFNPEIEDALFGAQNGTVFYNQFDNDQFKE